MRIVPPSGPPGKEREVPVTIRPKALVATGFSIVGALGDLAAYLCGCSHSLQLLALVSETVLLVACALFWRFERPRQVRLKGSFPEPPVIHGV